MPAARVPVHGPQRVLTLLDGLRRRYPGALVELARLAGGDGLVFTLDAKVIAVIGVELSGGRLVELNLVVNPAKLQRFQ